VLWWRNGEHAMPLGCNSGICGAVGMGMQRCRVESESRRVVMLCVRLVEAVRALRDCALSRHGFVSRALWIGRWRRVVGCCSLRMCCAIIYYLAMLLLTGRDKERHGSEWQRDRAHHMESMYCMRPQWRTLRLHPSARRLLPTSR
jgi:hypothetical protein